MLLVGETPGFAEAGGVLNFYAEANRVTRQIRREILGLEEWVADAERLLDLIRQSQKKLESTHLAVKNRTAALSKLI